MGTTKERQIMQRSKWMAAVGAACWLLAPWAAQARDNPQTRPQPARQLDSTSNADMTPYRTLPPGSNGEVEGKLVATDRPNRITIRDTLGTERALKVDPQTRVTQNGERVTSATVPEGTQVRASYVQWGDDQVVRQLEIQPSSKQKP